MASARDVTALQIYNGFLVLFAPFLLVKKALKYRRFRHSYEWDRTRWSYPRSAVSEKKGVRVALLGLGWAEVAILGTISRRLEAERPDIEVVWVVRDLEAREMAHKAFPTRDIVPMPFDFSAPTKSWLEATHPDVLIIVEKFWWPNLVWGAKLSGAKVVLVNGRSRGRDKARYKLMSASQRWIMRAFDLMLFESASQQARLQAVLPRETPVFATGNLKWAFERPSPPPNAEALENWTNSHASDESGPLPLLLAGSTAPEDEEWVLDAWQKVNAKTPCALLIAPRRPSRGGEVKAWLKERGFESSLRNEFDGKSHSGEILILDTMGELAYAYRYAKTAYVGGSVAGRGHNILEPLLWGIPVSYGPNRGDFEAIQILCEEAGVGFRLKNSEELAEFWHRAFDDSWYRDVNRRALALLEAQSGALELATKSILEVLPLPLQKD